MRLPSARGTLTTTLFPALHGVGPFPVDELVSLVCDADSGRTTLEDDDVHTALWAAYQLHYTGFDDVDDRWEWDPDLVRVRQMMERTFEADLRRRTASMVRDAQAAGGTVADRIFGMTEDHDGPSVSRYLHREATREQFLEFLVHRSIYNLQESDPHAFALPRLRGAAKVALAELLYDEFGGGRPDRLHSALFAASMRGCDLDDRFGAYVPAVPGLTLAVTNTMSLFALHRSGAAAAMGHLGAFEATSSEPARHTAAGIDRLGLPAVVRGYYDEHVEADAVHEQVALRTICGGIAAADPAAEDDLLFGAAACLLTEADAGAALLTAWRAGRSSLLLRDEELVAS